MKGSIVQCDNGKKFVIVDTRNDQYGKLRLYHNEPPGSLTVGMTVDFELVTSRTGNVYAKLIRVVERNQAIFNTEDRSKWYEWGEDEEKDFIEKIEHLLSFIECNKLYYNQQIKDAWNKQFKNGAYVTYKYIEYGIKNLPKAIECYDIAKLNAAHTAIMRKAHYELSKLSFLDGNSISRDYAKNLRDKRRCLNNVAGNQSSLDTHHVFSVVNDKMAKFCDICDSAITRLRHKLSDMQIREIVTPLVERLNRARNGLWNLKYLKNRIAFKSMPLRKVKVQIRYGSKEQIEANIQAITPAIAKKIKVVQPNPIKVLHANTGKTTSKKTTSEEILCRTEEIVKTTKLPEETVYTIRICEQTTSGERTFHNTVRTKKPSRQQIYKENFWDWQLDK